MPPSVIVAIVAVALIIAMNGVGSLGTIVSGAGLSIGDMIQLGVSCLLSALILVGIIAGHRLAWQWGRLLAILVAVLSTISIPAFMFANRFVRGPTGGSPPPIVIAIAIAISLVMVAGPLYAVFFALGRPSARAFFGLTCPKCGVSTNKAADFFFNKAKCRSCGHIWH